MTNTKFSITVHEKARQANNLAHAKRVKRIFDRIAAEAAAIGARTGFNDADKHFYFTDYPAANKAIDELLKDMHTAVLDNVQSGNADAWSLANAKNAAMVADLQARAAAAGREIAQEQLRQWSQTNLDALQAFQERKVNGMNLSSRVWNITDQTKSELELALEIGLGDGRSAAQLSRDVRSYLNEPNRLFRRVRDKATGVLRLSKAAQQYHTGRGVYRSSYKNALRMTATENNMAYRNADHERWQQIPWILGFTIKLSGNHPVADICDELQGDYPKEFKFTGWHPWCRCYCISKRAKDKDIFDALDSDEPDNYQFEGEIKDMPKQFTQWVKDNKERIQNAKSLPYFLRDNGYVNSKGKYKLDVNSDYQVQSIKGAGARKALKASSAQDTEIIANTVKAFTEENSNIYPIVRRIEHNSETYDFMATLRNRKGNVAGLRISTGLFTEYSSKGIHEYCPLQHLTEALQRIKQGERLSELHEYAIEGLWHELNHMRFAGWVNQPVLVNRTVSEAMNQFYARHTYSDFIRKLGGVAEHKDFVLAEGFGYQTEVTNLRTLLAHYGIKEKDAVKRINHIFATGAREDDTLRFANYLIQKGVPADKASTLLGVIKMPVDDFNKVLKGV